MVKKMVITVTLFIFIMLVCISSSHAGVLGKVKALATAEAAALALSAVLTILGGIMGIAFKKISRTFKEAGEFMTTLGNALEDKRLTREELAGIIKEGKDIFEVWG